MRPGLAALALAVLWIPNAAAGADPAAARSEPAPPVYSDAVPAGPSVEERLAEIARRVQAVANYPPIARARALSGETWVELRIAPDGTPEDVRTRLSSGSVSLDRAAERAVRDAAPLPRVLGTITVPVRFQLTGE
jgi:TonB family protein